MDDILKAIRESLDEALGEPTTKKEPVGKISGALLKEISDHDKREDDLQEYIQARLKLIATEIRREMRPQMEAIQAEHNDIWSRIYDEIGLSDEMREHNYSVSKKTGIVSRKVEVAPEEPFQFN